MFQVLKKNEIVLKRLEREPFLKTDIIRIFSEVVGIASIRKH
jgi:hypothetical protein